jgi:hypothetical protein
LLENLAAERYDGVCLAPLDTHAQATTRIHRHARTAVAGIDVWA